MLLKVGPHVAEFSSWGFNNIYFLDNMTDNNPQPNLHKEVPSSLHIMNHVYRYYNCKIFPPKKKPKGAPTTLHLATTSSASTTPTVSPLFTTISLKPALVQKNSLSSLFHNKTNKSFTRERPNQVLCMSAKAA